jgi:hypothetical protein
MEIHSLNTSPWVCICLYMKQINEAAACLILCKMSTACVASDTITRVRMHALHRTHEWARNEEGVPIRVFHLRSYLTDIEYVWFWGLHCTLSGEFNFSSCQSSNPCITWASLKSYIVNVSRHGWYHCTALIFYLMWSWIILVYFYPLITKMLSNIFYYPSYVA